MSFDLDKFRIEFLQSDGWKAPDCYKPYEDKFLHKDNQDAYEGAKWGYESRQAEIDELQKRIDELGNRVSINYGCEREDDQHSYWSGYNQAMRKINEILKGETK